MMQREIFQPEHELFRETVRRFLQAEVAEESAARAREADARLADDFLSVQGNDDARNRAARPVGTAAPSSSLGKGHLPVSSAHGRPTCAGASNKWRVQEHGHNPASQCA